MAEDASAIGKTMPEIPTTASSRSEPALHFNPSAPSEGHAARPDIARHVAGQLAEVFVRPTEKPVEIALNPEELGRVRMAVSASDTGVSVQISAERPETLDLIQRHIDQLAAEFRRLGYASIGFEFGDGRRDTPRRSHGHGAAKTVEAEPAESDQPRRGPMSRSMGLDVRF